MEKNAIIDESPLRSPTYHAVAELNGFIMPGDGANFAYHRMAALPWISNCGCLSWSYCFANPCWKRMFREMYHVKKSVKQMTYKTPPGHTGKNGLDIIFRFMSGENLAMKEKDWLGGKIAEYWIPERVSCTVQNWNTGFYWNVGRVLCIERWDPASLLYIIRLGPSVVLLEQIW